jgi:peptidoglycan/LPS O-acetylase OafA/YrhL
VFISFSVFVSETLLQMSQQMPEMKRTVSGFVVAKIIDTFQQIAPLEVSWSFIRLLVYLSNNLMLEWYKAYLEYLLHSWSMVTEGTLSIMFAAMLACWLFLE